MPRIILFGKSKRRTRTTFHLVRAFKERGNTVLWLNPAKIRRQQKDQTGQWILKQIDEFKPGIIFIYSKDIPLGVLRQIRQSSIKTVMYYEDMPSDILPTMIEKGKLVDCFLATNKGLLNRYQKLGITNPIYFVGACDRYDHRIRFPILPHWKSDIAFIGQARAGEPRVLLTRSLAQRFKVKVYGKNWPAFGIRPTLKTVTPRGYALVCSGAKIILGADITDKVEGYWSNRLWLTLGCGGFFLTHYVHGMETYFENKRHLVWYHNQQECRDLVEEYLAKPRERRKIALSGYRLVHQHHTFHHFVDRILAICNQDPNQFSTGAEDQTD
jgi:spore maturation protein CgeB